MPPVFSVKNLEDIRGFVGQDGVYIKHELVRGLNDAEPWRELELFTLFVAGILDIMAIASVTTISITIRH